jgi:hypothetical protein
MRVLPPSIEPPYDSPIEDFFFWHLNQYVEASVRFEREDNLATICGAYKLYLIAVLANGRRIAFECDGQPFHESFRDAWRDALVLATKTVDSIYRFNNLFVVNKVDDLLFLLSRYEPTLFSEGGLPKLEELASSAVKKIDIHASPDTFICPYAEDESSVAFLAKLYIHSLLKSRKSRDSMLRFVEVTPKTPGNSLEEKAAWYLDRTEFSKIT